MDLAQRIWTLSIKQRSSEKLYLLSNTSFPYILRYKCPSLQIRYETCYFLHSKPRVTLYWMFFMICSFILYIYIYFLQIKSNTGNFPNAFSTTCLSGPGVLIRAVNYIQYLPFCASRRLLVTLSKCRATNYLVSG